MENINKGYPIKYTILPIEYIYEKDKQTKIDAYIAMECQLLKEIKEYYQDGTFSTSYQIITKKNSSLIGPNFDNENRELTLYLFDTIEEAKECAREKNRKIYEYNIENMIPEELDNYTTDVINIFSKAYQLEEQLLTSPNNLVKKIGNIN